jgi:hypothetical protein
MTDNSHARLSNALKDLLRTRVHSKLLILGLHNKFPVHKAIVLPRAGGLQSICIPGITEAGNPCVTIDLKSEPEAAVKRLVTYFYRADYEPFELPEAAESRGDDALLITLGYDFPNGSADGVTPKRCPNRIRDSDEHDAICYQCARKIAPTNHYQAFPASRLQTHVKIHIIGQRYEVDGLRS